MRSNTWRALFLLSLTLILVSSAMDAQAARRSSLAGNQFINDPDDMFAFPQLTMQYKNRVIIDMAPNSYWYDPDTFESWSTQNGNGSIVFGDNMVWNFNTGRGDFLSNTATWAWGAGDRFGTLDWNGTPGSNGSRGSSLEWWDLGMATNLGDTPFGFNISWATDKFESTPPDTAFSAYDMSSSMISLQAGVTLGTVDIAAEVGFGSYENKSVYKVNLEDGSPETPLNPTNREDYDFFNFSLLARGDLDDVGGLDWRWIAAFASGSNESKDQVTRAVNGTPTVMSAQKLSTTAFRGAFGPVWGTPGEWEVAAYINFNYVTHDMEGENVDLVETGSYTTFPGYNFAMEYYLNSWLVARGGVMSQNATWSDKTDYWHPVTENVVEGEEKGRGNMFMWTLGLGVDKGNWGLDLALHDEDVHSGYLPLNGDTSEPIAYLTAWLAW